MITPRKVKVMLDNASNIEIADTAAPMMCAIEAANFGHGSAKSGLGRGLQAMISPNAFGTLSWDKGLWRLFFGTEAQPPQCNRNSQLWQR